MRIKGKSPMPQGYVYFIEDMKNKIDYERALKATLTVAFTMADHAARGELREASNWYEKLEEIAEVAGMFEKEKPVRFPF